MSRQLFGTDGIRGPAGAYPFDAEGMLQIGKAVGTYFLKPGGKVLIGWDPRESSPVLAEAAVKGLSAAGAEIHRLGVIPTPGLAYLTSRLKAGAGVIITASHNPYTDNGVKVFTPDGRKLSDDDQAGLNDLIGGRIEDRAGGTAADDTAAVKAYEEFLAASAGSVSFSGLRIAVDTANGATSGIAGRVFSALGAEVTALYDKPDGRNINEACGATDPSALQAAVRKQGLDAGVAFDGDGDRVIMVDAEGRQLSGDHLLYILAIAGGHRGVAATVMSNQGLETALKEHGIGLKRTPVGDRSVLAAMDDTGYRLGGEQSGHIIISDYSPTGDGMLAAILTLAAAIASGRTLASWRDELKLLPQALMSVPLPDKTLLERSDIRSFIEAENAGLGGNGRLNVRASGTEPKVRVMVEAPDAEERARRIAHELTKLVRTEGA